MRRLVCVVLVAGAVLSGSACVQKSDVVGTDPKAIKQLSPELLPSEILDLKVGREDMAPTLERAKRSYIEGVGLYSMRKDELLQATLQVSRFTESGDTDSPRFRRALVSQIGSSVPQLARVGRDAVYLTTGTKQSLYIWFRDHHMLILSVREDYPEPRRLLRKALEIDPTA